MMKNEDCDCPITIVKRKSKSKSQKTMGDVLNEINNMKQTIQSMKTQINKLKSEVNELKEAELKRVTMEKKLKNVSILNHPGPKVLTLQEEIDLKSLKGNICILYSNLHCNTTLQYFSKYINSLIPNSKFKCQEDNQNRVKKCFKVHTANTHLKVLCDPKNWSAGTIIKSSNMNPLPSPSLKLGPFKPSNWSRIEKTKYLKLIMLQQDSREYENVLLGLDESIINGVTKICRIQNVMTFCRFLLRQEEFKSRGIKFRIMELFHDTSEQYVSSIINHNFDWRRHTKRSRFGKGVYFGSTSEYCYRYSSPDAKYRALFVVDVIIGNVADGKAKQIIPPEKYDTTVGNNGSAYAKYYDDEFYPKYVVYYTD